MKKTKLTDFNTITKALLLILIVVVSYFIIFSIFGPFFITQPTSMTEMMSQMMSRGSGTNINILSLIIALIIGVIISFYLFKTEPKSKKDNELDILKKALSEDEKKILDEIKKSGGITQDSLRFRLEWSKAKVSSILINLDKMNLIQRERTGKTYKVYLQK